MTDELFRRIGDGGFEALSARVSEADREVWAKLEPGSTPWKRVAIHFAIYYGLADAAERSGLSAAAPPDDVHAMSRGSQAAGGSLYHADMLFGALQLARIDVPHGGRILDFGCSSGRVIRVVKAYRRDLDCHGCDPQEPAIRWAAAELPDISFKVSEPNPPLSYEADCFDCVFAVSIWSHFGERAAIAWLDEMHRIVKGEGVLILTTHSFHSVGYFASRSLRAPEDMRTALGSMLTSGFSYYPIFGGQGDWGIVSPDWGEAFISPEWLVTHVTPKWDVLLYRSGANDGNQDVALLRKRAG